MLNSHNLLPVIIAAVIFYFPINACLAFNDDSQSLSTYIIRPITSQKILPDTSPILFPLQTYNQGIIKVLACRGEYEPASIVLRALNNSLEDILLEVSDLRNEKAIIPARNIDIKVVKVWFQGGTAWQDIRADKRAVLIPELLLNDDTLVIVNETEQSNFLKLSFPDGERYQNISSRTDAALRTIVHNVKEFPVRDSATLRPTRIPARSNKQYWLTFYIPPHIPPGTYKGFLSIKSQGKTLRDILIETTVLPFNLEKPSIEYSIYYRGILRDSEGSLSSEYKNEEQLRNEYLNMIAHGVANPTVYQPFDNKVLLKRLLQIRKEVGLIDRPLYYLGIRTEEPANPSAVIRYIRQVKEMQDVIKPYNITDLYVYGIDEASPQLIEKQKAIWKMIRQTGAKIFAAGWTKGHFELVGGWLDLFIDGQPPSRSQAENFHGAGGRIFSYNRPQVGIENPYTYRKNYGLVLWQQGYDGAMNYAYQDGFGSIWNDFDHPKFRDHCFTYPTTSGVIDTIAWEGFREGIDDVRYINTLEKKIKSARDKTKYTRQEALREAEFFLERLKSHPGDNLDALRRQIIEHILNLSESEYSK